MVEGCHKKEEGEKADWERVEMEGEKQDQVQVREVRRVMNNQSQMEAEW